MVDKFIVEGRFKLPERVDTQVICDLISNDVMDAEDKKKRLDVYAQCIVDLEKVLSTREEFFR